MIKSTTMLIMMIGSFVHAAHAMDHKKDLYPLHEAVRTGNPQRVALLIDHKADVNQRDTSDITPLKVALTLHTLIGKQLEYMDFPSSDRCDHVVQCDINVRPRQSIGEKVKGLFIDKEEQERKRKEKEQNEKKQDQEKVIKQITEIFINKGKYGQIISLLLENGAQMDYCDWEKYLAK